MVPDRSLLVRLFVAGVVLTAAAAGAHGAVAQPDYQSEINDANLLLRINAGNIEAWLALNAGVRGAIDAGDLRAVVDAGRASPRLNDVVEQAEIDLFRDRMSNREYTELLLTAALAARDMESALDAGDLAAARNELITVQRATSEIDRLAPSLRGDTRLRALIFAAEGGAKAGLPPGQVRAAFDALRDELRAVVLPDVVARDGCRSPGSVPVLTLLDLLQAMGVSQGDVAAGIDQGRGRACPGGAETVTISRFRGDGTLEYVQELEAGESRFRVTLAGTYTITFDAPSTGGYLHGFGAAELGVTVEDLARGGDCGAPMTASVPLTVTGEASGGDLAVRMTPGALRPLPACPLPPGVPVHLGLPLLLRIGVSEQYSFTTQQGGSLLRSGPGYQVNWTGSLRLTVVRVP